MTSALPILLCAATKVMFFFDTEDFTSARSDDAIRDLATLMTEEGVVGEFNVVGLLAQELVRRNRQDVILALRRHAVGTQTYGHSLHPTICEQTDKPDWKTSYDAVRESEERGLALVRGLLPPRTPVDYAGPPGNSWSYAAMYAYADMGLTFFGGGGFADVKAEDAATCGLVPPGLRRWGLWYCNLLQLPYSELMCLEALLPVNARQPDVGRVLDEAAKRDFVGFYMHPHMAVKRSHWDGPNYTGTNRVEWGRWIPTEDLPPDVTQEFYRRLRAFVRRVKADPRFEITDTLRERKLLKRRVSVDASNLPAIRAALERELGPVSSPASYSVADVFQAVVALLRGETSFLPGKAYGFLSRPKGVTAPVTVRRDDLRAAAHLLGDFTFIPESIRVGQATIGPADFLFAGLEALTTGAEKVTVRPREQLGDLKRLLPGLEKLDIKGGWCIHSPDLNGAILDERLKLQLWTLRYE